MLEQLISKLPEKARVLDYGCFGWKLPKISSRADIEHHGCDMMLPDGKPEHASFHLVDSVARKIPVPDNYFDLVVASHVIEHVVDPIELFQELARVCKPAGQIYIEAPSDKSVLVHSDAAVEAHSFYSFWDDPTHLRPWTPAALYRLAICHGCMPVKVEYMYSLKERILWPLKRIIYAGNGHKLTELLWLARGWSCYAVIEKPAAIIGTPIFKYLSLKDVPRGKEAALKRYQGIGS